MVSDALSKRIHGPIGLKERRKVSKVKAVASSFGGACVFASYTVLPVMVFLWAIGFIQINF